ncbi:MAG: hypothetical protein LBP87_08110 [Planctomycetaceae bacterium]|nr:hypothetical protein [Planctomycetaceae bacterium]
MFRLKKGSQRFAERLRRLILFSFPSANRVHCRRVRRAMVGENPSAKH